MPQLSALAQDLKKIISMTSGNQRNLARDIGISPTALSLYINLGQTPKTDWPETRERLLACLESPASPRPYVEELLDKIERPQGQEPAAEGDEREDEPMILRKQSLTSDTRRHFRLVRNPFDDPQSSADVYLSEDSRFVREAMYDTAVNGGFLAVIGESGAGKTTLKDEFVGRMSAERGEVKIFEPYVLAMAQNDQNGKALRSQHIAESILSGIVVEQNMRCSPEQRFRKLHKALIDSSKAGHTHVLVIEEAHDLPLHTLKGLKRFWDLKDGLKRLLSIILIAQPELDMKMKNAGAFLREVAQRCEIVHLPPIRQISDFLAFRFKRAGADAAAMIAPEAFEALQQRLLVAPDRQGRRACLNYPLAISNLTIAAMNLATRVGEKQVTADVVRQVQP